MRKKEKNGNLDFLFECEQCRELWSENLLDLIDQCTPKELLIILEHIKKKFKNQD